MKKVDSSTLPLVIRRNRVILFILFLIYPLSTLPLLFYNIYNKRDRLSFLLLAVFLGYISLLYPPTGDLYVYTTKYYLYKDLPFDQFYKYYLLQSMDYILQILLFILAKFEIHCDISRFLYSTFSYYTIFKLYNNMVSNNLQLDCNKPDRFKCLLLLIFCFSLTIYTYRFYFSFILLLNAIYELFILNRKRGWFWLFFAIVNHFSYMIFLPLLFLAKLNIFNFNKWIALLIICLIFLIDTSSVGLMIQYLPFPGEVINHIMYYLDGYFAGEYLEDLSFNFKVGMFLRNLTLFPALIFFIVYYKKNKMTSVQQMMLSLLLLLAPFVAIYYRFVACTIFLFLFSFIYNYKNDRKNLIQLRVLCFSVAISFLCTMWFFRREFSINKESKLLYLSSFSVLNTTYSEKWIDKNVDIDGAPLYVN
ncbi:MAG: EpsG family protein [Tannerellaceae bacterium]|nr:EpsG family protein [Tannerellaceae bacterium]